MRYYLVTPTLPSKDEYPIKYSVSNVAGIFFKETSLSKFLCEQDKVSKIT